MSPLTEPTKLTLAKGQPVPNDPYLYTNTVLLLHGDGANGSTNIVDSSRVAGSPKIVTPVGNAQISTAVADPFGNNTGVLAFDGTGDYLASGPYVDFAMGLGDFTWEAWIYPSSAPFFCTICSTRDAFNTANGLTLGMDSSRKLYLYSNNYLLNPATTLALNTWHYVAAIRLGSTLQLFLNGVSLGTAANSQNFSNSSLAVGSVLPTSGSASQFWSGYIDELRITKAARYTSNFTPPTAPFPDF